MTESKPKEDAGKAGVGEPGFCCPVARPTVQRTGQTCDCFLALETASAGASLCEAHDPNAAATDEK